MLLFLSSSLQYTEHELLTFANNRDKDEIIRRDLLIINSRTIILYFKAFVYKWESSSISVEAGKGVELQGGLKCMYSSVYSSPDPPVVPHTRRPYQVLYLAA